jgi:hypothetical protein
MMTKKTMLSMIAAAALVTGFTGCSSDTNNVSTTSGNNDRVSDPKGTVTGTVMDTNGNPLAGVKVYAAGMETTTDAGGIYVFEDVPVVNTANQLSTSVGLSANQTRNGAIQVTIEAPAGYLGATVLVTPEAQQISSGDPSVLNGGQTNPNTNFIDGYLANAGTAVLPALNGTVHGVLENANNGTRPAGVEVCLDLMANSLTHDNTNTAAGNVSYATTSYCAATGENGVFDIVNVPSDARLRYNLADWNLAAGQANSVAVEDTVVTNIGELRVVPIVTADTIAPMVAAVKEGLLPNTNGTARMMLVDDARDSFTIVFSEPINVDSDGSSLPDTDMTDSVNVYVGNTAATMTKVNATATYNGNELKIELSTPLTDGQLVDVHLVNADFRDMGNNFLTLNGTIGYDAASSGVTTLVRLQAFNDLNLNAPAPTGLAQQKTDENGIDDLPLLTQASNAFNDVRDGVAGIQQMNSVDDDDNAMGYDAGQRLFALAWAITGGLITVDVDVPRVTFTPNGAAAYIIGLQRNGVDVDLSPAGTIEVALEGNPGTLTDANTQVIFRPTDPADVSAVEFVLTTKVNARPGDVLTITPMDDLGYAGTAVPLTLADNVNPTTVIQLSYLLGASVNGSNTVVKYGAGGELSQNTGEIKPGLPYLAITAGLLDNLNGTTPINGTSIVADGDLSGELFRYNTRFDDDNDPNTPNVRLYEVYDSNAYIKMPKKRTMGVAFSEDIALSGTPKTSNISATLDNWKENNDVTVRGGTNGGITKVNADLIDMDVDNVIKFANDDNNGVIDYTAVIADNAGNVADADTNAKVVVQDKMPPMVTKAFFDGSNMVITFNEPVKLAAGQTVTVNGKTSTYAATTWKLSADKLTLTIDSTTFGTGLAKADFTLGEYVELAYGSDKHQHAAMEWTVEDVHGNEWVNENAGVAAPAFAAVETIGNFAATTNNTEFVKAAASSDTNEKIVWTFNQKIVTGAGELFNACGTTLNDTDDNNGNGTPDIDDWFEYVDAATNTAHTMTGYMDQVKVSLDSTCKVMTMTFVAGDSTAGANNNPVAQNDVVRNVGTQVFTSDVDNTQTESVSASANNN